MHRTIAATLGLTLLAALPARAEPVGGTNDKYRITAEEMSACGADAISLCSFAYPDEDKLLSCMKLNRVSLSSTCRPVFDAGIRRRHL